MLGDLRKRLDAVGRLDVLDSVGVKALDYYSRQDPAQLDPNALGGRAHALHLLGEMREQRGELDAAQTAFEGAADTTSRLLARTPEDPHRIFDHAQSVYWVGHLAYLQGRMPAAEKEFREYLRLADHLVQIDAASIEWQTEAAYARGNIGVILLETSRVPEALAVLGEQRDIWRRIVVQRPAQALELANNYGWIAKAYEAQGNFERAIETQKEKSRVLERVPNAATNQLVRRSLRVIANELARLELILGHAQAARQIAQSAVETAQALVKSDPQNKIWLEQLYLSQATLAETQFATGDRAGARDNSQLMLAGSAKLAALDPKMAKWQVNLRGRALALAAQVVHDDERAALTKELDAYLGKIRQFATTNRTLTQERDVIVAQAELQLGLLLAHDGRSEEAADHWRSVATRVHAYADRGDLPALTVLATAEFRLGDPIAARAVAQRIESTPYRHPAYADLITLLAAGAGPLAAKP
jgi:eukaryotic-like serine/threonine-protein kinase